MHTSWFFADNGKSWLGLSSMLLEVLSLFAVPLFMSIAGYLFASRNEHAYRYNMAFFRKMFLSVLSPYLMFSMFYILVGYVLNNHLYTGGEVIFDILTGSAVVHFNFFRALIGFYFVYPWLMKMFTRCRISNMLPAYFLAAALFQLTWKILNDSAVNEGWLAYVLMITTFLRYIVYFSLGIAASCYKEELLEWIGKNLKKLAGMLIIFVPLVFVCWMEKYYWKTQYVLEMICFPLNMFLYTTLIAMIFYCSASMDKKENLSKNFILYLGNYSFGIFLMHIFYMYLNSEYLLPKLGIAPNNIMFYPLMFILMLVMSIGSMELLVLLPFYEPLIGKIERKYLLSKKVSK